MPTPIVPPWPQLRMIVKTDSDVQDVRGRIWLLTVYTKSARENIAVATLNALRELADHAEID